MVERLRHHPWVNSPSHEAKRLSAWLDTLDPSGTCQYPAVLWAGLRENWSHSVGNDLWQTSVAADQRVPSVPHRRIGVLSSDGTVLIVITVGAVLLCRRGSEGIQR